MDARARESYVQQEAREEGRKEGIDIGRLEERASMASALISKGMDVKFISEVTGLSASEINEIIKPKALDHTKH